MQYKVPQNIDLEDPIPILSDLFNYVQSRQKRMVRGKPRQLMVGEV